MKYSSVFDIIGPVMIGPSSSHTAGAARIGRVARDVFGREPKWARIHLYGSFAKTYKGHGTDRALVGGLFGFDTDSTDIAHSLEIAVERGFAVEFIAEQEGANHPNTARIIVGDETSQVEVVGVSVGGGKAEITEINGFQLKISGEHTVLLVLHYDRSGVIANVAHLLAKSAINIANMDVSRKEKGQESLMTIEVDDHVAKVVIEQLLMITHVIQVTLI